MPDRSNFITWVRWHFSRRYREQARLAPTKIIWEQQRMSDRFDKFTERARKTLQLAQEEAQRLNHSYIGTEHILLGLVREGDGVAARVLTSMGVDLHKVRSTVEFIIGRGDQMVMGEVGLTPRAKRVIEFAVEESRGLGHHYIGTEHLLLGLAREGEGIAAGVLESLGISLSKVRAQVIQVLKSSSGYRSATAQAVQPPFGSERSTDYPPRAKSLTYALEVLATLVDYSFWARDQLLTVINTLSEEQLHQADEKGVYGSILHTLAHMAISEWMWVQRCEGKSPTKLPQPEDFADLRELLEWWQVVHDVTVEYLNTLHDEDLDRQVTYTAPDGKTRTRRIWHMLLQVVNHQTEHRAQIGTMLGQMGLEVPQTDLVVYLSE
jgi:uncharacterized damage-inducible protein DinB